MNNQSSPLSLFMNNDTKSSPFPCARIILGRFSLVSLWATCFGPRRNLDPASVIRQPLVQQSGVTDYRHSVFEEEHIQLLWWTNQDGGMWEDVGQRSQYHFRWLRLWTLFQPRTPNQAHLSTQIYISARGRVGKAQDALEVVHMTLPG